MNAQRIKSCLIETFGEHFMAYIQAIRFYYLLMKKERLEQDPELAFIRRFLKKGEIAIDIGANGADYTYCLHQCVGEEGYVYAFEADPYYALATDITIKLMRLKNVRLFSFGLSNVDELVPIRVNDPQGLKFSGESYVDKIADKDDKGIRFVQLKRLDSMVEQYPSLLNTALIKCDVEGYELCVFEGCTMIIEQARPFIILEVGNYSRHGYSSNDIHNFFEKRNYISFAVVGENKLSETDNKFQHDEAISVNRIMIPNERIKYIKDLL